MKSMLKVLFLIICLTLFVSLGYRAQSSPQVAVTPQGAEVGKLAPDFSLKDMSGKTVELKSYKGKKVVLVVFWSTG